MSAPYKTSRLVFLFLAFAWGVIGGSVGLNALIKSNQEKTRIRHALPPGATLTINSNDVYTSGIVLTTVCALIALLTLIYFILTIVRPAKWIAFQAWTLGFCALWLFAVQIPFDQFVRVRSAQVAVTVGGVALPYTIIQRVQNSLGVTAVYRHIYYLRLPAVLPWFTILFTFIACCVLAIADIDSEPTPTRAPVQQQPSSPEQKSPVETTDTRMAEKEPVDPSTNA